MNISKQEISEVRLIVLDLFSQRNHLLHACKVALKRIETLTSKARGQKDFDTIEVLKKAIKRSEKL